MIHLHHPNVVKFYASWQDTAALPASVSQAALTARPRSTSKRTILQARVDENGQPHRLPGSSRCNESDDYCQLFCRMSWRPSGRCCPGAQQENAIFLVTELCDGGDFSELNHGIDDPQVCRTGPALQSKPLKVEVAARR